MVGLAILTIATVLNVLVASPIAIVLLVATIIFFFQYKWRSSPYIEIEGTQAVVRFTWVKNKAQQINLEQVVKVETPKNKRIILHLDTGRKVAILVNQLTEEDKARALKDIPAIVEGNFSNDLAHHLVE